MSEAQRAAAKAEEKRNRKLAKAMALSGKARKRQELDDARLLHNQHIKAASEYSERRRNDYIKEHLELLGPFVRGAKRSLQAQLGLMSEAEAAMPVVGRGGRRKSDADAAAGAVAGTSKGSRAATPIEDEIDEEAKAALTDEAALAGFALEDVMGVVPEAEVTAEETEAYPWLEASLQPHQVAGLNWMIKAYRYGINGILADEMGLGKTIQTISFLGFLKFECHLKGPSLVVAPLSVLTSWVNEFKRFAPKMRIVRLHSGDQNERELMRTELLADISNFDVVVTTYEMANSANMKTVLCHRIHWRYLVLDEGHRIKNEKTALYERLRLVKCQRKLLLTGTPLQNNLHELWALLHFLHPELFADSDRFDQAFDLQRGQVDEGVIAKCGQLLHAFMIRRLKLAVLATLPIKTEALVYCPMSKTQVELSRQLLLSGAEVLKSLASTALVDDDDKDEGAEGRPDKGFTAVQSLLLSLRKTCNHPQLFGTWMGDVSAQAGEDLVSSSGKLATLEKLLDLLLPNGHRVVLFSGWTSMLDLIEQFLRGRSLEFCRLDGSTNRVQRQIDIKQFNQAGSTLKVFLCSTRAGGLGITLTSADTVVLYDSDFNPQVDLQAMDRVHRIGQKKPVRVLRLITHDSVEERIVQRARDKLFLMQRTMAAGVDTKDDGPQAPSGKMSRSESIKVLQFGVAGAMSALERGDLGVTSAQVRTVYKEIEDAMVQKLPSITVGVGGRRPSAKQSQEVLDAAATSLGTSEDKVGSKRSRKGKEGASASVHPEVADLGSSLASLSRSQRERTSRFIQVGEDLVLKLNNYALHEGEQSVFESELQGRKDKDLPSETSSRRRAGVDYKNQPQCQVCWGEEGELLECDFCPGTYHAPCIGIEDVNALPHQWSCPHHKCNLCDRRAHAAGGLLFRCSDCEKAFCEDHLPIESELIGGEVDRLLALGFGAVKQACYCLCSDECKGKREQREEEALEKEMGAELSKEGDEDEEDEGEEEDDEEGEVEDGEEGEEEGEEEDEGEAEDEEMEDSFRAVLAKFDAPKAVKAGSAAEYLVQTDQEVAWASVDVKSLSGGRANVVYTERTAENGKPLTERVKLEHLRPQPPAKTPKGFEASLVPGAPCELWFDAAWWPVTVLKPTSGGKFQVSSDNFKAKHTVPASRLRPGWAWSAGASKWSQREPNADE